MGKKVVTARKYAGVSERVIVETPLAIVDVETTGLKPDPDRVIEIAVVRIDPGEAPRLVLDTLVNPGRDIAATDIHGIADEDVVDAPIFSEIAGCAPWQGGTSRKTPDKGRREEHSGSFHPLHASSLSWVHGGFLGFAETAPACIRLLE